MKKHTNLLTPVLPGKNDNILHWGQLYGASAALAISAAARQHQGLVIIIVPNMLIANRLEQELNFFLNHDESTPILSFPDWETLPYDHFSPHQDIISQRLYTLYRLPQIKKGILIASISTLMSRIPPRDYLDNTSFVLAKGDKLDPTPFRTRLQAAGYYFVSQVVTHGEFTIRGSIIDLFPMGSKLPYRIDLFDDEVDSIRTFDPETQRSLEVIEKVALLPAREFPLTEAAITNFRQQWRGKFTGNPANSNIYTSISSGESAPGVEYYLPLFFEKPATLFDYLAQETLVIRYGDLPKNSELFWQEINERYDQLRYDIERPILPPQEIFLSSEEIFSQIKKFPQINIQQAPLSDKLGHINFASQPLPDLSIDSKAIQPLTKLQNYLQNNPHKVLFTAETTGRRESLLELLRKINCSPKSIATWQDFLEIKDKFQIAIAGLEEGIDSLDPQLLIISEAQLYGQQIMQRRLRKRRTQDSENVIRNLTELNIGAPVVHIDHGIGLYLGLQLITTDGIEAEYLTLEFSNAAKLYVPVANLDLISRYTGANSDHISLNYLGTRQWEKTKRKAAEKIRDVAAELLDIYARRAAKKGHTFADPKQEYEAFAAAFPFETTPDQQQAIQDIIHDMTSEKMMDRLVCGDVGFGKTEVAMRAAFMAVQDGQQVAILVPTTLLAEQHYENFKDRFADWPFKIAVLSRFHGQQEHHKIIQALADGKVDIVIGTHKLLQPNIHFKSLGLLIIDEEHRFGVKQKDKIKSLRAEVDILNLTATPIPRTLNMALAGMRDLSFITTPPARRLAVKTFVQESTPGLIREAILREIMRGGQVYFLHNDVASIEKTANELQKIVPEAKIRIGHGQMHEKELSQTMADFYHARFNVLVCTTIIESGIDVPTANTIIINRADRFGLAQLHQLRGRVGRSHHQAYAYLLIPSREVITSDAQKRLDAIESIEDLGAGFMLANYDLEIRGAGELLGEEQSGNIHAIGFSLYMELLEDAVNALKSGKEFDLDQPMHHGVDVDLHVPALIPETLIGDVHVRLTLYKRIASAKNNDELNELQVEIIDRFGLLPPGTKNLFAIAEIKLVAKALGIKKIDIGDKSGRIEFDKEPNIDLTKLIKLIQTQPKLYKLDSQQRLLFTILDNKIDAKIKLTQELFEKLKKT